MSKHAALILLKMSLICDGGGANGAFNVAEDAKEKFRVVCGCIK